MLTELQAIYQAICRSIIRFFDNRFVKSDEVQYLRMELEMARNDYKILARESVKTAPVVEQNSNEEQEWKPVHGLVTWDQKRKKLELESMQRAAKLAEEARLSMAMARDRQKSTEQLESELLSGN